MSRHRGIYNIDNPEPYEISRTRIENFIQCPACFYMQQVEGIKFPSFPGYNINEATDILLKKDFDKYRGEHKTHPYLINQGLEHLIPFEHPNLNLWTQSLHFGAEGRMNFVHKKTNLKVGGGLDDVWFNTKTKKLHIVDYKSTSQKKDYGPITLDDFWKNSYKRQMDLYVWVMKKKGFNIDKVGYFLYCDGDRFTNNLFLAEKIAYMEFKITLIPYETDVSWIENTLFNIKANLNNNERPLHHEKCEFGSFLKHSFRYI